MLTMTLRLAEYGYDGVDFDWEYPGVDDHGGSADNGVNYTTFLKELREAIDASGKDFIVMFTAPISYWYLKNLDLANMMQYVDWVDIMSYDLHGVWDSDDQWIGNQVLAHTNITEIACALDLVSVQCLELAEPNWHIILTIRARSSGESTSIQRPLS